MFRHLASLFDDELGTTIIEYSLIISLLALTCLFGIRMLGTSVNTQLSAVTAAVGTTASAPADGGPSGNNSNGDGNGNNGNNGNGGNGGNGNNGNGRHG
jgi:Flp pilus assembly pilin Flp